MKILLATVFVALSLSAITASAGEPAGPGHAMDCHHPMDHKMDGKGAMTAEEHRKMAGEMFATIDADKDGSLSRAEFDKHHEHMRAGHQHMKGRDDKEAHDHAETHK